MTALQRFTPICALVLVACAGLALLPGCATAQDYESERRATVRVDGATTVSVIAKAGNLTVEGADVDQVEAVGTARADDRDVLDQIQLRASQDGATIRIEAVIPDRLYRKKARLDLTVRLPRSLDVEVDDSSGDAEVRGLGGMRVRITDSSGDLVVEDVQADLDVDDSSGDLDIRQTRGSLTVNDSSGDLGLQDVQGGEIEIEDSSGGIRIDASSGTLRLTDSSGDIRIDEFDGSVTIVDDSSGNIRIRSVTGSVRIEEDSSGGIDVRDIGGDFTVVQDGSGSIRHENVRGTVSIPEDD